jgi:hypothetical protein
MVFVFALAQISAPDRKHFFFFRYSFLIAGLCNLTAVYR